MRNNFILLALVISTTHLMGSDTLSTQQEELTDEQMQLLWEAYTDSIEQSLNYEFGQIKLKKGLASVAVPEGFKYLNGADSEMILTDLWGNPPSEEADKSLGMLIPKNESVMSDSSYVINITYSEEGYIDDEDAKNLDYDELLSSMQDDTEYANEYRVEQGYEPIELIGWASKPFYDFDSKKLHWAKELKFGDYPEHTLNYNIRILGRKGYLELNAIGSIEMVDQIKNEINPILGSVDFSAGNRYSDFNPDIDKVAAYGIGGLIAGKVLAKAGLLAKLGLVFAKFWKILLLGLLAFGAFFKRIFSDNTDDRTKPQS